MMYQLATMMAIQIKAIPTYYNGQWYRSRTEAQWAVFFDFLGIKYIYEKEGFDLRGIELKGVWYLPDFWIPALDCWIEIKGEKPTDEAQKKAAMLCAGSHKTVAILAGRPWEYEGTLYTYLPYEKANEVFAYLKNEYDGHMRFVEEQTRILVKNGWSEDDPILDDIRSSNNGREIHYDSKRRRIWAWPHDPSKDYFCLDYNILRRPTEFVQCLLCGCIYLYNEKCSCGDIQYMGGWDPRESGIASTRSDALQRAYNAARNYDFKFKKGSK